MLSMRYPLKSLYYIYAFVDNLAQIQLIVSAERSSDGVEGGAPYCYCRVRLLM
jgi:hypothetical protein